MRLFFEYQAPTPFNSPLKYPSVLDIFIASGSATMSRNKPESFIRLSSWRTWPMGLSISKGRNCCSVDLYALNCQCDAPAKATTALPDDDRDCFVAIAPRNDVS